MIFVTLGSQKFQFDRLLKAVDELIEKSVITEPVFAQTGYSKYEPKHYEWQQFLDHEEFGSKVDQCDIVITHGGTGVIVGAVKKGKKVIAVPRLAEYGEHVDDHQLQLVGQFRELNLICACYDLNKLDMAIDQVKSSTYNSYQSNTVKIADSIASFIDSI